VKLTICPCEITILTLEYAQVTASIVCSITLDVSRVVPAGIRTLVFRVGSTLYQ